MNAFHALDAFHKASILPVLRGRQNLPSVHFLDTPGVFLHALCPGSFHGVRIYGTALGKVIALKAEG